MTNFTEGEIFAHWLGSLLRYGLHHTHDISCQTWRGKNWHGACDCSLRRRYNKVQS